MEQMPQFQNEQPKIESRNYEVAPGEDITSVAENTILIAKNIQGPITATFNEHELTINPGDTVEDVVKKHIQATFSDETLAKHGKTVEGMVQDIMTNS